MNPKLIAIAIIVVFFVWGFVGGIIANPVGVTCDVGVGDLCWKWHKNFVGEIIDVFS